MSNKTDNENPANPTLPGECESCGRETPGLKPLCDECAQRGAEDSGEIEGGAMTGEQFLNSLRFLDCEITALDQTRWTLDRTRQDVLDRALTSPNLSGVCVQSMPGNKTAALGIQLAGTPTDEQLVQKLRQVIDKVNRKIDELVDRKRLALIAIDRIPDTRLRALLILRYVNTMGWDAINGLMGEDCVPLLPGAIEAFSAAYQS